MGPHTRRRATPTDGTAASSFLERSLQPTLHATSRHVFPVLLLLLIGLFSAAWTVEDIIRVGAFSEELASEEAPNGWEPLQFKKIKNRTTYSLVEQDGVVVVKAVSNGGAAGLVKKVQIDPQTHPILSWRWKAENVLRKGDVTRKDGDDYAARIYITFDYDPSDLGFGDKIKYNALKLLGYGDIPLRALNYLWASKAEEGQITPNPYTNWVMMIPAETGSNRTGQWVAERRNILEDYRAAFGEDPPPITGVAIMTDTDNTGESAVAYYGDITFEQP